MSGFDLRPGRRLAGKYEVIGLLGSGYEGEVYKIVESTTGIECAAKLFFPERNPKNKASSRYARKLHALRSSPFVIQYQSQETIRWRKQPVTALVSEYVQGPLLADYLRSVPRKRLNPFQAVALLHAIAVGLQSIHEHGFYHGDLHDGNLIVCRVGLQYELRCLDFYDQHGGKRDNMSHDIIEAIRIFYDALGGQKHYAKQPPIVKHICRGLRRDLILKRFRTASDLRRFLETLDWGTTTS
ncbi:MAG: protein kinase [Pseudomonadota bacterium]